MWSKRKIDETITDFGVKQGDPPIVQTILNTRFPNYDAFLRTMTNQQFDMIHKYTMKQKNMDRVIDFIIDNETNLKSLKD